ncbi:MAG: nucleotidyltransferase family protein [Alphaproteobacteria bacterium]|nr:nucleotidyltransferase family protein [Alphaproteobacteria bacterium]
MTAIEMPKRAMVLAAGRGKRMRPLSDTVPKPLLAVAKRTLLERTLDRLTAAGIEDVVVNLHHLGDRIRQQLDGRDDLRIHYSEEPELLETGGGLLKALDYFEGAPFFVANGDVLWQDGESSALLRMAEAWDATTMDGLLLVQALARATGYDGKGDFEMGAGGRLARRAGMSAPYVFTGVQLLHPRLFAESPQGPFSLNLLYDRAIAAGRLFGLAHEGTWYHVGTVDGLKRAEARFRESPA